MHGRPTLARPARAAALAAAAALALSACGSSDDQGSGDGSSAVAATVDGQTITVGDVQRTTRELRTYLEAQAASTGQQPQQLEAANVLTLLVQTPAVLEFAEQEDLPVASAASMRSDLAQVLPSASDKTIDFLRANTAGSELDQATQADLVAAIEEQQVTISPRYATASNQAPEWLEQPVEEQLPMEAP